MRTRATKAAKQAPAEPDTSNNRSAAIPEKDPVKLLILPQEVGLDARICTLAHPATSKACRYYWCPSKGLCELQRIAAPKNACRSWLLAPESSENSNGRKRGHTDEDQLKVLSDDNDNAPQHEEANGVEHPDKTASPTSPQGHTIQAPEIVVATPIDLLFIILPSLHAQISKDSQGLFLSLEDLLDISCEKSKHLRYILKQDNVGLSMEARVGLVCDTVNAGDEIMYRLNMNKLMSELLTKAKRMVSTGLPASMEAKFVEKALETPMLSSKRDDTLLSHLSSDTPPSTGSQSTVTVESQSTTISSESIESQASIQTDTTVPDQSALTSVPENIKHLIRLRTALDFIMSSYMSSPLASVINTTFSSPTSPINFEPLETHLSHIAKLRAEAQATRSFADFSRKRSMVDDDEAAEEKAEKKRKKEEEEKRQKTGLSRGIRELKKVDVTGMKKMSDFFGKKAGAKGK
ncbi:MAG: hypothetical protein Q9201_007707 [Fulgogasparrea decipioides]